MSALEAKLGLRRSNTDTSSNSTTADISTRLNGIQAAMDKHATPQFKTTWNESQTLLRELDPGAGLTHQQQPLLYKRQEVLAASESLKSDMNELSQVLHLLLTSQARQDSKGSTLLTPTKKDTTAVPASVASTLREDQVTQAPILTSMKVSPEDQRRLDALRLTIEDLNSRTQKVMMKLDHMVECYHSVVTAASEKCILADEALTAKGK